MAAADVIEVRLRGERDVTVLFPAPWLRVVRGARQGLPGILSDWPRALVAIDGPMFETTVGTDRFGVYDGVTGARHGSTLPAEGLTVSVAGGVAAGAYGWAVPPHASVALQTWPSLVRSGRPVYHDTAANRERVWRAGMGVHRDGRVVFVVLVGSMADLSDRMAAEGIVEGGYLDGGHSVALDVRDRLRRVHTAPNGSAVPTWVLVMPPDGVQASVVGAGGVPWRTIALALGGTGAAVVVGAALVEAFTSRRKRPSG